MDLQRSVIVGMLAASLGLVAASARAAESGPPPSAVIVLAGIQVRVGDVLFGNGATRLAVQAERSSCAVERRDYLLDGAAGAAAWGTLAPGPHAAEVVLTDSCGQSSRIGPFAFVIDVDPPTIKAQAVGNEIYDDRGEPDRDRRHKPQAWTPERGGAIAWSADGRRWLPLAWGDTPTAPENGVWSESAATADHPQVLFAGQGWKIVGDDGAPLANDRLLYVTAEDAGSGIAKLIYRTKAVPSGGNGEVLLEVEAVDLVGNSATRTWKIGRR